MVNTLNGLEKAIAVMKLQSQKTADQIEALSAKLDDVIWEFRASLASQLMTFPKFDGSEVLVWLARANQYFLLNKTPSDRRVDFAMLAVDGPAKPWKQLLVRRCPSLSWDKFVHELLSRFGDTIPQESRVTCNSSKYSSEGPSAAVHVAKNQPKISPTMTAPLLSSSLPTTAKENTLHAVQQPPRIQQTCKPSMLSRPIPIPVLETTPLLPLSHDIPLLQLPSIPLPEQKLIPAAATFQSTPTASLSESISALLDAQSLNGSQSYERGKRITTSKLTPVALACPLRNVSRPSSAAASHIKQFLSSVNERSNKLHFLLHVYGQIFVCTLTSVCKHEYDPPPTMYCVFGFQIQPCGQGCFESEAVDTGKGRENPGGRSVLNKQQQ